MKRSILLSLMAMLCAGTAVGQAPGSIGIFGDQSGYDCNVIDNGAIVQVHVIHVWTDGATGSFFKLDVGATGWTHLSDTWNFLNVVGISITGVSIGYGVCIAPNIYLGTVWFLGTMAPPCTYIEVVPSPTAQSGKIEAMDCSPVPQKMFPTGGTAIVNGTNNCTCDVPTRRSTWGMVKSLYQ